MQIVDFYNIQPKELKVDDVLVCTLKAHITEPNMREGYCTFRIYRCPWPFPQISEDGIPQGDKITSNPGAVGSVLFPVLDYAGCRPDRF